MIVGKIVVATLIGFMVGCLVGFGAGLSQWDQYQNCKLIASESADVGMLERCEAFK